MVRLRMKAMGRRHRPFFRICAMDSRRPRRASDRRARALRPDVAECRDADRPGREPHTLLAVGRCQPSHKVQALLNKFKVKNPHRASPGRCRADAGRGPSSSSGPGRRQPRRNRPPPDRSTDIAAAMAGSPPHRIDVLTLFPALFDRFLEPEHPPTGDRQGTGRNRAVGYPRLGRGEAQAGRRSAVRRRSGNGPDGPAGRRGNRGRCRDGRAARPPDRSLAPGAPARSGMGGGAGPGAATDPGLRAIRGL